MSLDPGRNPEHPEKIHTSTGRIHKLHPERMQGGFEPSTSLMRCSSANYCTTVLPQLVIIKWYCILPNNAFIMLHHCKTQWSQLTLWKQHKSQIHGWMCHKFKLSTEHSFRKLEAIVLLGCRQSYRHSSKRDNDEQHHAGNKFTSGACCRLSLQLALAGYLYQRSLCKGSKYIHKDTCTNK